MDLSSALLSIALAIALMVFYPLFFSQMPSIFLLLFFFALALLLVPWASLAFRKLGTSASGGPSRSYRRSFRSSRRNPRLSSTHRRSRGRRPTWKVRPDLDIASIEDYRRG